MEQISFQNDSEQEDIFAAFEDIMNEELGGTAESRELQRNQTIGELVSIYGNQEFQYGSHVGTVAQIVDVCPYIRDVLDSGSSAAEVAAIIEPFAGVKPEQAKPETALEATEEIEEIKPEPNEEEASVEQAVEERQTALKSAEKDAEKNVTAGTVEVPEIKIPEPVAESDMQVAEAESEVVGQATPDSHESAKPEVDHSASSQAVADTETDTSESESSVQYSGATQEASAPENLAADVSDYTDINQAVRAESATQNSEISQDKTKPEHQQKHEAELEPDTKLAPELDLAPVSETVQEFQVDNKNTTIDTASTTDKTVGIESKTVNFTGERESEMAAFATHETPETAKAEQATEPESTKSESVKVDQNSEIILDEPEDEPQSIASNRAEATDQEDNALNLSEEPAAGEQIVYTEEDSVIMGEISTLEQADESAINSEDEPELVTNDLIDHEAEPTIVLPYTGEIDDIDEPELDVGAAELDELTEVVGEPLVDIIESGNSNEAQDEYAAISEAEDSLPSADQEADISIEKTSFEDTPANDVELADVSEPAEGTIPEEIKQPVEFASSTTEPEVSLENLISQTEAYELDNQDNPIETVDSLPAAEIIDDVDKYLGVMVDENAEYVPAAFYSSVEQVEKDIAILRQATSAEECGDALDEIRKSLIDVLVALGCYQPEATARYLMEHHTMSELHKILIQLLKARTAKDAAKITASRKVAKSIKVLSRHVLRLVVRADTAVSA